MFTANGHALINTGSAFKPGIAPAAIGVPEPRRLADRALLRCRREIPDRGAALGPNSRTEIDVVVHVILNPSPAALNQYHRPTQSLVARSPSWPSDLTGIGARIDLVTEAGS